MVLSESARVARIYTYLNAKLKKCVFNLVLNVFIAPALRKSKGSAFHSFGAAAWNERSPRVVRFVKGTTSFRSARDRRQYCPSQTDNISDMY